MSSWQEPCVGAGILEAPLRTTGNYDDWTIDRWRIEPRLKALDADIREADDSNPPLWKDLTLASFVAVMLWIAAAAVFR